MALEDIARKRGFLNSHGYLAHQLAKLVPEKVRCIISIGSPFVGSPKATNAWRPYEMASGSRIEEQDLISLGLADAPPVPTTSIFSRTDGICAWQNCLNQEGPQVENIGP